MVVIIIIYNSIELKPHIYINNNYYIIYYSIVKIVIYGIFRKTIKSNGVG